MTRCADCRRILWPWQATCGPRHRACKHEGDRRIAERNGVAVWLCAWCGR